MFTQIVVVIAFINLNLQLCNPHMGVAAMSGDAVRWCDPQMKINYVHNIK